ncbi:hypothetical protein [Cohnella thailandensis]|uniref:Uncharacterized protein n=1 Tax=Cohnella thailandensis TaxID=557557 RepID=A0A841SQ70_9BACL|nr:hypothetical protein [Cohnella thailandensis]MBB6632746.1 hypothetical protein [Cohnella thailandensis]MBP1975565.1 hypothetical protein [Cohnella thailandensis]
MSRVIAQLTTDTFYNVDLTEFTSLLQIPLTKTSLGYIGDLESAKLLIGSNGGIKLAITFDSQHELNNKLTTALQKITPLITMFEAKYNISILNKLLLSWSGEYVPFDQSWSLQDNLYKEFVQDSDFGFKYSELIKVTGNQLYSVYNN